jgi:hypothetical protein
VIAENTLAAELGGQALVDPDISIASDGSLIALFSPAIPDPAKPFGALTLGCDALELVTLDPPVVKRDCAGHVVIRAKVTSPLMNAGSCTQDAASKTGILMHSNIGTASGAFLLNATGLKP